MAHAPRTLVVVDDDADVRRMVRIQLETADGYRVVGEGCDGQQAIELADRHHPELLLLDLSMPGTDGLAALPRIKAVAPDTQVVLYTAIDEPELASRAIELGAAGLVEKSAGLQSLAARLAALGAPAAGGNADAVENNETLRQSEDSYRALVESVQDYAIFMLAVDGRVVSWNAGAARIKGYSAEEIIGRHFRAFYPVEDQQRRHPEHELQLALRDGHYEEEGWRIRKDGSRFWANVLITPVHNDAGAHIGFAKVTRDIDERRQMVLDLEQAGADLAASNAELATANEQLRIKADEQAEFLAVTAHELRNPVSVLSGSATLLVRHWSEMAQSDRDDLASSITSTAQRLERLLADLLTASRLESSAIALDLEDVELSTLLAGAVATARAKAPEADVRLDAEPGLWVATDAGRLGQVIDNLIANALRHGASPVRVSAGADDGRMQVTVSDCGPGVPDELRPRLFERFAAGRDHAGTGLGLFIVRELVRAHGGEVWYEPAPGGGACFGLSIPIKANNADTLVDGCTPGAAKLA